MDVITSRYQICKPLVAYRLYCMADTTSCDNNLIDIQYKATKMKGENFNKNVWDLLIVIISLG